MKQSWPKHLWIARHGESASNVARDAADKAGTARIDIGDRDVDVPLSALGHEQSEALGRWFAEQPRSLRPNVVISSPYKRAVQTAAIIGGCITPNRQSTQFLRDERLREKELGILDRLTRRGIRELHPEQAEFRRVLGKFYHRPPAGESWCDVILRLRSALDTISLHHSGERVLIVAHRIVVLCLRYIIENLDEAEILRIDAEGEVAHCGITEYAFEPDAVVGGKMVLRRYNFLAPLYGGPGHRREDASEAAR